MSVDLPKSSVPQDPTISATPVNEPLKTESAKSPSTSVVVAKSPVASAPRVTEAEEPQAEVKQELSDADRLAQFCKDQVSIENVPQPSRFKYRGVCKKCGFQSYELTKADASGVIANHAMKHWYNTNG